MVLGNIPEINFHFIGNELNYFIHFNFLGNQTKHKEIPEKENTEHELHPLNLKNDDEHRHRAPIEERP